MKFCNEKIQKHLLSGGKIKRKSDNFPVFLNDNNGLLSYQSDDYTRTSCINKKDLTADDWEILRPEYDWDKIIKDKILCQFWYELEVTDTPIVGYLTKKTADGFQGKGWYCIWKHCKPFDSVYFNAAKNIEEYEKNDS